MPEVRLTLTRADGTGPVGSWAFAGVGMRSVRVRVPEASTYDVHVEIPGYLPGTATGIDVTEERESRVDVLFGAPPE